MALCAGTDAALALRILWPYAGRRPSASNRTYCPRQQSQTESGALSIHPQINSGLVRLLPDRRSSFIDSDAAPFHDRSACLDGIVAALSRGTPRANPLIP